MMGARETALNALIACRKEDAWPNGVLKNAIRHARLDSRDAALATRLCYGVLQNRNKLDFYLKQLLTGKLKDLHPVVRDILHLGLYQIYETERIPDSAAVNESVTLAKKYCKNPKAASLVNGVLRSAVRTRGQLEQPKSYADLYSHPDELISLLKENLPKGKLEGMLIADNATPQTVVQVNTLRASVSNLVERLEREHVTARPHLWMKNCLVLSGVEGENLRVLDCCAAPGGKSFAAAIAMEGKGQITSCDVYPHKVALIESGAARLGIGNITPRLQDATEVAPVWSSAMDVVLVDAPCSGLGIIRKKPDLRYKNLQQTQALPVLQKKILETQARYVKPGGVLMYSTCTVLRRENEEIVEGFLKDHGDFSLEKLPLPSPLPYNETGMLTLIPGQYDTDGFFICRMRRNV